MFKTILGFVLAIVALVFFFHGIGSAYSEQWGNCVGSFAVTYFLNEVIKGIDNA